MPFYKHRALCDEYIQHSPVCISLYILLPLRASLTRSMTYLMHRGTRRVKGGRGIRTVRFGVEE
jgi:hypothetical protein